MFHEGVALARLISGYWEIINTKGEVIGTTALDPIGRNGGTEVATFHDGRALVENLQGKKVFINTSGTIVGGMFDEAFPFSEGVALVKKPGLSVWSFIGPDGSFFMPYSFLRASSFSEGVAAAERIEGRNDPGMGFINKSGEYVLRPHYREARPFSNGLAWVVTPEGTCAAVDRVG
ncbi:MAG: WG repeat-containing protein [Elusimicrobia bacterium]|nr:WG repeat-containing protein [Elusimicrobiota bacterium]